MTASVDASMLCPPLQIPPSALLHSRGGCSTLEMCFLLRKRRPRRVRPAPSPRSSSHARDGISSSFSSSTSNSSCGSSASSSSSSIGSLKELLPKSGPALFSFAQICASTSNFNPAQVIGQFAWKGVLGSSPVTIVKKQGIHNHGPFLRHLHFLHHANIVHLVGICMNGPNLYFVYPFVDGARLQDCLQGKLSWTSSPILSWRMRIQIALDVAKGLEYLHHLSFPSFVHRHIESRNILITHKMRAKIANIGLAQPTGDIAKECCLHQESQKKRSESFRIQGIHGYMPPEYAAIGRESPKYDVFSFGVVLAEILSGRAGVSLEECGRAVLLAEELQALMEEPGNAMTKLRLWMDPHLGDAYPMHEAYKAALLAASCVDPEPQARPTMSFVANQLQMCLLCLEDDQSSMGACTRELLSGGLEPRQYSSEEPPYGLVALQ